MNRVITINLNGHAYQLEESGYEILRAYLDDAARRLEGNPDKDEIIADIEQAIADKFRAVLGVNKTVVITKEVQGVITEMGPVEDGSADGQPADASSAHTAANPKAAAASGTADSENEPKAIRRLYLIEEGAMISGVCNGLAAFLKIDVTAIRILFVFLCYFWGTGVLLYLLLAIIVPAAKTPAEKSAATGTTAATAQEFIRRAKAGYYEGMKTFHDKHARREWKRKFKQEMRGWKHGFQREMSENAHEWQQNWSRPWAQHPRAWIGMGFTLEILKWVKLLLLAFGLYAVYSLATKGSVFGLLLPAGIPAWIGIIGVIVLYQFVTWPIKAMRYACYYRATGYPEYAWPCLAGPLTGLIWLGFLVALIWLADHYVPQFHEALKQLPPLLHQAIDSVQKWLDRT